MISPEDVCNKALNYLEVTPISSLDENSIAAIRLKSVFDTVRDEVLAGFPWRFATFFEQPDLIADETIPGWAYLYAIPLKCLSIRKVFLDDTVPDPEELDYRQCISPESLRAAIAVNETDPWIEYTRQVTDPKYWTAPFAGAFSLRLAAEVGAVLTGKPEKSTAALQQYVLMISEAKRLDANAEKVDLTKPSSYESARG